MLEDRSYMRQDSWSARRSVTIMLLLANLGIFVLQEINDFYIGFPIYDYFALSNEGLGRGFVWQLFTFQFLHAGGWHLVFNLLGIFFFGRAVEARLGSVALLKIYFLAGALGGVVQAVLGWLVPQHFTNSVVGASAGVYGLLAAMALMEPDGVIFVSLLFPVRAKYVLYVFAAISVFYILVPDSRIAHGAHLGGMIAGVLFLRWDVLSGRWLPQRRPRSARLKPRELLRVPKSGPWARGNAEAEDLPPAEFISREVDPILDKINAHGIHSLTPREKRILEAARSKMERR